MSVWATALKQLSHTLAWFLLPTSIGKRIVSSKREEQNEEGQTSSMFVSPVTHVNRSLCMKNRSSVGFDLRCRLSVAGGRLLPKSHQGGNLWRSSNLHVDQRSVVFNLQTVVWLSPNRQNSWFLSSSLRRWRSCRLW